MLTSALIARRMAPEDPFADPVYPDTHFVLRPSVLSPVESVPEYVFARRPKKHILTNLLKAADFSRCNPHSYRDASPTHARCHRLPVSGSEPPWHRESRLCSSRSIRTVPSSYSMGVGAMPLQPIETEWVISAHLRLSFLTLSPSETRPLLPRGNQPRATAADKFPRPDPYYSQAEPPRWPGVPSGLQAQGWIEYVLPDSVVYFFHPSMHITTDINLRNSKKLDVVTAYLENGLPEESGLPPMGWELWLRDAGSSHRQGHDFVPVKHWVHHGARVLSFENPRDGDVTQSLSNDDSELLFYLFISSIRF
ncbi:hypothetical protein JAAARDRAFT_213726 [Jaapia argillacea MUCL 33604]|uniref:Uncharacterized protein n=1 Tax=Jaapia argillacea MUCL 33604 TaxID=933084 RepID=A0A067QA87_9AGAM|nr:hypothetical protein JAAARDRAFT_213726 [Jaapia argillacea MUCL 33604]